jgi:hypothetical protein
MLGFFNLLLTTTMKNTNLSQRKGIAMLVLGFLSLLITLLPLLAHENINQGMLSFGICCVVIGLLFYFVKGKKNTLHNDEMSLKIWTLSLAATLQILVIVGGVAYLIFTLQPRFQPTANQLLASFLFSGMLINTFWRWRYSRNVEKLPF